MYHTWNGYCGPGFIYIAEDGDLYKIGCTKEGSTAGRVYKNSGILASVTARFYHLNKDHDRQFKLLHVIYTPICVRGLEKMLHGMFADKRPAKHEWFRLSAGDLEFLFNLAELDGYELTHMGV
jgi:hypothetical protein